MEEDEIFSTDLEHAAEIGHVGSASFDTHIPPQEYLHTSQRGHELFTQNTFRKIYRLHFGALMYSMFRAPSSFKMCAWKMRLKLLID